MAESTCESVGCNQTAEAALEGRQLCRSHFYDLATKRVEECVRSLRKAELTGNLRIASLKMLSELISQTTTLTIRAKFLSPWQREQLHELSVSALGVYKRVQRSPRVPVNMPILLVRKTGSEEKQELTYTVNISKTGGCFATSGSWSINEKMWVQKPPDSVRTIGRVAWIKKNAADRSLVGVEILDQENFWGAELTARELG